MHAYSQLDILRPNHLGVAIIIGPPLLLLVLGTFQDDLRSNVVRGSASRSMLRSLGEDPKATRSGVRRDWAPRTGKA